MLRNISSTDDFLVQMKLYQQESKKGVLPSQENAKWQKLKSRSSGNFGYAGRNTKQEPNQKFLGRSLLVPSPQKRKNKKFKKIKKLTLLFGRCWQWPSIKRIVYVSLFCYHILANCLLKLWKIASAIRVGLLDTILLLE